MSDTDGTSAATASSPAKSPLTPQEISDKIMERVHKAEEYKSAGNESYKAKDIKSAIGKYHRGLLFVKGLDSMAQQDVVQRLAGVGKSGEVFGSPGTQDFGEIIGKLLPDNIEERVAGIEQSCYNNLAGRFILICCWKSISDDYTVDCLKKLSVSQSRNLLQSVELGAIHNAIANCHAHVRTMYAFQTLFSKQQILPG